MLPLARAPRLLLASLLILPLAGCRTLTGWTDPPPSSLADRKIFYAVPNYSKAPCEYQRAWAAHNSKVASLDQGKEVVLKAPCDSDPKLKQAPAAKAAAPTS
jgi:hypothetical protein